MGITQRPQVVFFGSGPVAANSLSLLAQYADIEAVITKPSTERDMAHIAPNAPIFVADSKRSLNKIIDTQQFSSRVAVLIDYGVIVSQRVIDSFELGIINSHFSLLPQWRGADPITHAILSGQSLTGVSLMLLVAKMDEGPIIAWGEQPLTGMETTTELTDNLIHLSNDLLRVELPRYLAGDVIPQPQEKLAKKYDLSVSYSRKLTKQDGILDFTKSANQLEREIRAFVDWPKSRTTIGDRDVIITAAHAVYEANDNLPPGKITTAPREKRLKISCAEGVLYIDRLKPAGKPDMSVEAFLAGYNPSATQ
ncbi:hypothetical protein CR970_01850 [Candidatus Saccharibacteria bacterium]|nr:MAG: hypothetical protein CR970_01850 [Candidatus Saccharibacteria bacterium]